MISWLWEHGITLVAKTSLRLFLLFSITIIFILCFFTPTFLDKLLVIEYIVSWVWALISELINSIEIEI